MKAIMCKHPGCGNVAYKPLTIPGLSVVACKEHLKPIVKHLRSLRDSGES